MHTRPECRVAYCRCFGLSKGTDHLGSHAQKAHHKHTDQLKDPHARSRGFFWSHMGWTMTDEPNGFRVSHFLPERNLLWRDPLVVFLEKHFYKINFAALALGMILLPWQIWLWAFPLRIVAVWHCTWIINSYLHYIANDGKVLVRDSRWVSLFTYGEGFHKFHHTSPAQPVYSEHPSVWDFSGLFLRVARKIGLVDFPDRKPTLVAENS